MNNRDERVSKENEAEASRDAGELAEECAALLAKLDAQTKELDAFSYSISHDLRAPLRAIHGFTQILKNSYGAQLPTDAQLLLQRVCDAALRMGNMLEDLLKLSRVTRQEMHIDPVDLSALAKAIAENLRKMAPERNVEFIIAEKMEAYGDAALIRIVIENLLDNAWKFTSKHPTAKIEFGAALNGAGKTFFFRDDGAGFDMAGAARLFGAFQRLHTAAEFPGTGIGLASVQRIIHRHNGRVWAESAVEKGAGIYFTLPGHPQKLGDGNA